MTNLTNNESMTNRIDIKEKTLSQPKQTTISLKDYFNPIFKTGVTAMPWDELEADGSNDNSKPVIVSPGAKLVGFEDF